MSISYVLRKHRTITHIGTLTGTYGIEHQLILYSIIGSSNKLIRKNSLISHNLDTVGFFRFEGFHHFLQFVVIKILSHPFVRYVERIRISILFFETLWFVHFLSLSDEKPAKISRKLSFDDEMLLITTSSICTASNDVNK